MRASESTLLNACPTIHLKRDRRQHRADDDARHQRKRHRDAEIAEVTETAAS